MNWRERASQLSKGVSSDLTKPTEAPSVSSVSSQDWAFQSSEGPGHRAALTESCAPLADFREALLLGRLHVCCNCTAFAFGADPAGLGHCQRFNVEAWPFVPFWCSAFEPSRVPAAPEYLPSCA